MQVTPQRLSSKTSFDSWVNHVTIYANSVTFKAIALVRNCVVFEFLNVHNYRFLNGHIRSQYSKGNTLRTVE